jgi:ABC-type dipeptide/oligopeptide/nickel transport system permease subunit
VTLGRALTRPVAAGALLVLAVMVLAAVTAPLLVGADPAHQQLDAAFAAPSDAHPLGTDHLGRDLLSRLLHGGRTTLSSAFAALGLSLLLGLVVGLVAGVCGRWVDALLMRLTDVLLAFPSLLLALALAAAFGAGMTQVVAAIVAVGWAGFARTTRGLVLACREQEYVLASVALGASRRRIMRTQVLPNVLSPVLVVASVELGHVLLTIAGLSFLGLGVQPPAAEWGAMLRAAQPYLQTEPALMLWPSAAIVLVVLSATVLADRLRDALDPTHHG